MLPSVSSLDSYRLVYRDANTWLPALRTICQRHGLDPTTLRMAPPGTHIVFWVEGDWLIKLFCPLWPDDTSTEILLLNTLADWQDFQVPLIRAQGELEGWLYLVLSRLPGQPLDILWDILQTKEKIEIAASLGQLMAALHHIPTAGLESLLVDWRAFLAGQRASYADRQQAAGASPAWLAETTAFLADSPPLFEPGFTPVLLNADLNPEHLFCEESSQGWRITGLIDFGDAMLGHPYYEFIAPGFLTCRGPALRRAMLLAYGFALHQLDETLSRTLLAYTLLHRFANLPDWLALWGDPPPANLAELQDILWGF